MAYELQAQYAMDAPRWVHDLPTIGFARRKAAYLLAGGAKVVTLYRVILTTDGPQHRFVESIDREQTR